MCKDSQHVQLRSAELCSNSIEKMHKPLLPRGSETTVKQSGSALKVFNKAETGTDMPDTNIHYCKVIAKSSSKITLSWPIPYSLIITKKSIQVVIVTMKITNSKMYRSEWLRKKNQHATRSVLTDLNLHCSFQRSKEQKVSINHTCLIIPKKLLSFLRYNDVF